ncbi:MAG: efflux RND transporter permease subunit [Elusimicrobia bacterium]|nr:efflux RND transporter permease subunit [Elusimicrobiota bacterium]
MINGLIDWCAKNRFFVFLGLVFAIVWGIYALKKIPLDAIPDLSDVQTIVFTEWPGRSPNLVEDQITYPIVTAMLGAPKVKVVRGYSFFGLSFVYIIFQDGTDLYWARSRTLEYLSKIKGELPGGVDPYLGPDATGAGWVYEYALVDKSGRHSLADLRAFQDWSLRYWLESVPGVAEVASIGGYVKQYQIVIDPEALLAYRIPLKNVIAAVRRSNNDVGGGVVEMSEHEYMVRGRGYVKNLADLENVPVGVDKNGAPILIKDIGYVRYGPAPRRGVAELDGQGETVGGIVVMRYGENALKVINAVKAKIAEVKSAFPPGVELVPVYDRSSLVKRSIATLRDKLIEEMIIVSLVIIIFLWHFRSALIPVLTLPLAALMAFIPMIYMNLGANIMSLGGIAIAIGAMVDAAVIMVENAQKHLELSEQSGGAKPLQDVILEATKEVGRPLFFSLLVIAVSFLPIFTLQAQEGRLFKPLAYTKTFSMFFAAFLAVTLVPVLMQIFLKPARELKFKSRILSRIVNFFWAGKIYSEEEHPVSRALFRVYDPALRFVLARRRAAIVLAALLIVATIPIYLRLGSEFMPNLNEGDLLYMPTTLPGISIEAAKVWLQHQDEILKSFPEVKRVFGTVGRARTATDNAPLEMVDTTVELKPQQDWPETFHACWYSSWAPQWLKPFLGFFWPEKRRPSWDDLVSMMDQALQLPGTSNVWTMPIKARVDMTTTGIRTPVGIKIYGPDLSQIQKIGEDIEGVLRKEPGTRSAFAQRTEGGYFIDFKVRREEAARYGLTVEDVEDVIETAIGGENVTTTVEGRERYPVNIRYPQDLRRDPELLRRVLVAAPTGAQVPIGQLADIKLVMGPPSITDEDAMLTGWVYVDLMPGQDVGGYVEKAKALIAKEVTIPPGYYLKWSGQYQYMQRARKRIMLILPLTLFIIFVLLYVNTGSVVKTGIVFLAVPFSLVGAVWLLYMLGYNMSVAVWVGIIALAGVDAETGVVMLLYLDLAYEEWKNKGKMRTLADLEEAVMHGAVKRVRPKMMTVLCLFMGLLPVMWAPVYEAGADVMKRIAAPMVGGIFTSFIMELLIYPAVYTIWKWRWEMKEGRVNGSIVRGA